EDVAGPDQVVGLRRRVGQRPDRVGPVGGGDPGGDAVPRVHADRVRGAHALGVLRRHEGDLQAVEVGAVHRDADDAAGVTDREGQQLRGRLRGGEDDVALVLAVLVVDDHDGASRRDVGERGLDGVEDAAVAGHTVDHTVADHAVADHTVADHIAAGHAVADRVV